MNEYNVGRSRSIFVVNTKHFIIVDVWDGVVKKRYYAGSCSTELRRVFFMVPVLVFRWFFKLEINLTQFFSKLSCLSCFKFSCSLEFSFRLESSSVVEPDPHGSVDLALLDPDSYRECGSGSRRKEIDQIYN